MNATNWPSRWRGKGVSVGTKLAVATVALLALVSVGVYFALTRSLAETLLTSKGEAAEEVGLLFAANISAAVVFEDPDVIAEGLRNLAKIGDVAFAAVWPSSALGVGKPLSEYARAGHQQRSPLVTSNLPELTWTADIVSLSVPVRDENGKIVAHALVEFSLDAENTKIAVTRQRVLIISSLAALAVALLLLIVSRHTVVVPLRRLQAGARQVERGESAVFDIKSEDEVGDLARALTKMAGAIGEREEEIRRRNRDMRLVMDNVGQGFLTLDEHGVMSDEYSMVVAEWFGEPRLPELLSTYLARVDPEFASWFALGLEQLVEDVLPIELVLAQTPARLSHGGKTWSFEYRPLLTADARFEGLIVVISDVTHLLEKAAAEQTQRETIVALTCMSRDAQGFLGFLSEGEALLSAIEDQTHDRLATFRHIHTLKGISAMMELHAVVEYCHDLEEQHLDRPRTLGAEETRELRRRWVQYRERIQPLLASSDETGFFVDQERYSKLVAALAAGHPRQELLDELSAWSFDDTQKPLERLAQHARQLATRLDKGDLSLAIESSGVRIPRDACGSLWIALVHAVRNAVDHGLEPTSEREALGKPARGALRLATCWRGEDLMISISDDGRGIDYGAIAERAKRLGLPHETPADLEKALFSEGLTTRDAATETSGRGIGTSALDETVKQLGGHIEIESTLGRGTTFKFLIPKQRVFANGPGPFSTPSDGIARKSHAA